VLRCFYWSAFHLIGKTESLQAEPKIKTNKEKGERERVQNIALIGDGIMCPDGNCKYPPGGIYGPKGVIVSGSAKTYAGGRQIARVGDIGICGGPCTLVSGSSVVFVEGALVHRVGDRNSCQGYTIGPGAPNVFVAR
jgi:uncharacterized Zn-binding protein involved in type VI secretion